MEAYCGTCRAYFTVVANPPHAVIHKVVTVDGGEKKIHLHPISRVELKPSR